jgi:chemotaxis protein methyltransferase WspC
MDRIETMLRETMGLDATSVGCASIERIIRLRMKCLGMTDTAAYRELLRQSRAEWDELVEAVVVAETWFFRDPEAFGVVVDAARRCRPGSTLRVLTIPCSSGEEPYSLAIALREAGIDADRFRIDAVDISSRAIARARKGIYSKNSFRGKDLGYRNRYFDSTKNGFILQPEICNCVKFFEGNLLDSHFAAGQSGYDFVFCRNLLIYFDRPTQEKVLERLNSLLASSGILFVGAAEQPLALENGFVSGNFPRAFACRKAVVSQGVTSSHIENDKDEWKMPLPLPASSFPASLRAASSALINEPENRRTERLQAARELERARQLADAGRLKDAAELCERYLDTDSDSAQGWYLLGLIRDASGDLTAVDCYRKALYLKPDHYESLVQMALWSQKSGDSARARTFKARAERAKLQVVNSKAESGKARYA